MRLFVERAIGLTRTALVDADERVLEVRHFFESRPDRTGAIHAGRVTAVRREFDAAFVDIGGGETGFLPLKKAPKGLAEGQRLAVKITAEATGRPDEDKSLRLSAKLTEADRASVGADDERPGLRVKAPDALARLLAASREQEMEISDGGPPLFEEAGIEAAIDEALSGRHPLPSGGDVVIEETEAFAAIDVNAGAAGAGRVQSRAARIVNREAAALIVHQLRLQNLGGLIVIDFLKMPRAKDREAIRAALNDAVTDDPAEVRLGRFGSFGLLALTRARSGPSLRGELLSRMETSLTPEAAALALLRRALPAGNSSRPGALILSCPAEVGVWLKKQNSYLAQLAEQTARQLVIEEGPVSAEIRQSDED